MMKRTLRWTLILALVATLSPLALAADAYAGYTRVNITTIGEVPLWNDITAAISNAKGPTYITINQDVLLANDRYSLYVVGGKDIVIDMKGHYFQSMSNWRRTSTRGVFFVESGAKVTLINGGIRRINYNSQNQAIRNYGEMTLENWVIDDIISHCDGAAIQNGGTMTIRGGKITNCHSDYLNDKMVYSGGAVYNTAGGTLTTPSTTRPGAR